MIRKTLFFILLFVFVCGASAFALTQQGGLTIVSTAELKTMLDKKEPLLLVNPLPPLNYGVAHIPGSTNIPLSLLKSELPKKTSGMGQKIVFYCLGPK
ncbi:MAG: hypothetical protein SVS15_04195 [Thermodesulfobacteriota bacterium]|nr:hypothetical protein [Thermodesulfobacteriota bacterium]